LEENFLNDSVTFSDFVIDNEYLNEVSDNVNYNKIIYSYYERLFDKYKVLKNSLIPISKLYEIQNCNKFWLTNLYVENHVIDYLGTYSCKDKFCNNCKKLKQAVRLSRYTDLLSNFKSCLYHIVFTIPNVNGIDLHSSIDKMSISFRKLMRIIQGNYRCFIDFSKYDYLGALRSLEVTFVKDLYHPHYHCFFAFKDLNLDKKFKNTYSYSNRSDNVRLFSEFEIILQKLWYMIYNNILLTKSNFDSIDLGYSVIVDKAKDEDFIEVFKYITKATDEKGVVLSFENFETLYFSLYRIKQIQGYGVFYRIKDEEITNEEVNAIYKGIQLFLQTEEKEYFLMVKPRDLINLQNFDIISRKKIFKYLKENKKKNSLIDNI
jgi:hypothetical protein